MRSMYRHCPTIAGWLKALGPAAALLAAALLPQAAQAATTISLFKSFAGNLNFVTTGNTLRSKANNTYPGGNACTLLSGNTGTSVAAGTSSSAVSGIPAGSTIVAAYLYYAGSGATVDSTVTFNGTAVTASRTFTDSSNATGNPFFSGFVDVTSLVTGNGTYSFTGLNVDDSNTYCANSTVLAGWGLFVIYSNATERLRVINVFDGFEPFQGDSITLTPNNFQIPTSNIDGKFAVLTWEGDPDINSTNGVTNNTETLQFNGNVLSDACNPTADTSLPNGSNGGAFVSGNPNQYNSTINTLLCTGTATTDDIYYGVDLDTFDVSSYLTAGSTTASSYYSSGQDLVFLSTQVISVTNTPVSDLAITKSHTGTLSYGNNTTWTLAVSNNGPITTTGTTKVTDTLPTGVTYVSATGSGWTCSAVGQVVTCNSTAAVLSGSSFPNISLTATIGAATVSPLANTATVSTVGGNFDNNSANNSSTDSAAIVAPDLSTSTKSVFNTSGGDAVVGSTLQYTITINETAGVQSNTVSVSDDIPANLSGFTPTAVTVTGSTTTVTNSSTATGGTNSDGLLSISNITVPANGTVTIVFTAQVASGTSSCAVIGNTATVTNPNGPGATPSSNSVTVAQSTCTANGSKILYVYDGTTAGLVKALSRIPQVANTGTAEAVAANNSIDFTLTPVLAKSLKFANTPDAGNVTMTVRLIETATGGTAGTARATTVELRTGSGTSIATSASVNVTNGPTLFTYTITVPQDTVIAAGDTVVLRLHDNNTTRTISFSQKTAAQGASTISFNTPTVINVDSVTTSTTNYPTVTAPTGGVFLPGQTVYVCAVVSDPFGSADTDPVTGGTAPQITLTDPNGTVQVSAAAMTKEAAANCSGTASTATEAFEYSYATSFSLATGFWTASVTASEGTEGTITQTSNSSFDLDVPSLLITKTASVASDPVEGTTRAKAIPGATVTYTITVQNNGRGPVDSGTLVISDPVPTNTAMSLTGKPPFTFTNGSTVSGLSVTSGSDANIVYSNNGGTSYTYVPSCTRPCTDTAVTNFKITFTGSMNGKTGSTAPSFNITFNVVIQ